MGELAANNTSEMPMVIITRKAFKRNVKGYFMQKLNKSREHKY